MSDPEPDYIPLSDDPLPPPCPYQGPDSKLTQNRNPIRGHSDAIQYAALSPSGNFVITGSRDNTASLWHASANSDEPLRRFDVLKHPQRVFQCFVCDNASRVVTACSDGSVRVWTRRRAPEDTDYIKINRPDYRNARACQISADGTLVVATLYSGRRTPLDPSGKKYNSSFEACVILQHVSRRQTLFEIFLPGKVDQCRMSNTGAVIAVGLSGVEPAEAIARGCSIHVFDQSGDRRRVFKNVLPSENACTKWDLSENGDKLVIVSNNSHEIELYEGGIDSTWDKPPKILMTKDPRVYTACRFLERGRYILAIVGLVQMEWKSVRIFSARRGCVVYEIPCVLHNSYPLYIEPRMSVLATYNGECEQIRMLCRKVGEPNSTSVDLITSRYSTDLPNSLRQAPTEDYQNDRLNQPLTYLPGQSQINSPYARYDRSMYFPSNSPRLDKARDPVHHDYRRESITHPDKPGLRKDQILHEHKSQHEGPDYRGRSVTGGKYGGFNDISNVKPKGACQSSEQESVDKAKIAQPEQNLSQPTTNTACDTRRNLCATSGVGKNVTYHESRDPRLRAKLAAKSTLNSAIQTPITEQKTAQLENSQNGTQTDTLNVLSSNAQDFKLGSDSVCISAQSTRGQKVDAQSSATPTDGKNECENLNTITPATPSPGQADVRDMKTAASAMSSATPKSGENTDPAVTTPGTSGVLGRECDPSRAPPLKRLKKDIYIVNSNDSHDSITYAPNEKKREQKLTEADTKVSTKDIPKSCNESSSINIAEARSRNSFNSTEVTFTTSEGVNAEFTGVERTSQRDSVHIQCGLRELDLKSKKIEACAGNASKVVEILSRTDSILPKKATSFRYPKLFAPPPPECTSPGCERYDTASAQSIVRSGRNEALPQGPINNGGCQNDKDGDRSSKTTITTPNNASQAQISPPAEVVTGSRAGAKPDRQGQLSPNRAICDIFNRPEDLVHLPLLEGNEASKGTELRRRESSPDDNIPIAKLRRGTIRRKRVTKQKRAPHASLAVSRGRSTRKVSTRRERSNTESTSKEATGSCITNSSGEVALKEVELYNTQLTSGSALKTILVTGQSLTLKEQSAVKQGDQKCEERTEREPSLSSLTENDKSTVCNHELHECDEEKLDRDNNAPYENGRVAHSLTIKTEKNVVTGSKSLPEIASDAATLTHQPKTCVNNGVDVGILAKNLELVTSNEIAVLIGSNSESGRLTKTEDVLSMLQRKARLAFDKAADRVSTSGQQYITGAQAFKTISELLKYSAMVQEKEIAKVVYGKTGSENMCTATMFVEAFCELYREAQLRRRPFLERIFTEALPDGERLLLVYHARDLLKQALNLSSNSIFEHWTDPAIADVFEAEGSGMLVDVEAFVMGAEKIICGSLGGNGDIRKSLAST